MIRSVLCFALLCCAQTVWAQNQLVASEEKANLTDVSFKDINGKDCIENIARHIELKVQFEESLKSRKITLSVKDVTLAKALAIALLMQDWRAKQLPNNVILVIPDTDEARQRHASYPDWASNSIKKN